MQRTSKARHNQIMQQIVTDEVSKYGLPTADQLNNFAAALGMTPVEYKEKLFIRLRNFRRK